MTFVRPFLLENFTKGFRLSCHKNLLHRLSLILPSYIPPTDKIGAMFRRYFLTGSVWGALSGENLVGSAVVPAVSRQIDTVAGERLPE
jgi:hypothetical protein